MRCVPYYACCGAYFLCEIEESHILDKNIHYERLPRIRDPHWENATVPDVSKASVAYHIAARSGIAYLFAILKQEEKALGELLCKVHGFKLMSSTKDRLLYCRERGK
jgi:hypothetical protein